MSDWYSLGERISAIPVDDRGFQYGDGVFETVAIRDGQPRFWALHCERLVLGCERLGIPAPPLGELELQLGNAVESSYVDRNFATAKIIVTAGQGPRGYGRQAATAGSVYVWVGHASRIPDGGYRHGIETRVCETRAAIQPRLAGIKSLNRIEQVLARAEWQDESIFEGLMLDTEDRLICGTMSNVFMVTGESVVTPNLTRCGVAGIMRDHVMAVTDKSGIDLDPRDVSLDEMEAADEVFLTNSQFGILPVARCGSREWPVGDMTRRLMFASGIPECHG